MVVPREMGAAWGNYGKTLESLRVRLSTANRLLEGETSSCASPEGKRVIPRALLDGFGMSRVGGQS